MTKGHLLPISLVFTILFFAGLTTPRMDTPNRVAVSPCCNGDCCCIPGQCKCCEDVPEVEQSDTPVSDENQGSGGASFWRSLACTGHTTALFHSGQDSYILGFGPPTLFGDDSSEHVGPNIPIIKDVFIPPPDKIPKLLS
ncbi:MAG: hypothetical protein ACE5IC_09975 [Candidatus Brocadiales bacterium]